MLRAVKSKHVASRKQGGAPRGEQASQIASLETRRVAGSGVAVIFGGRDLSFRESGCAQAVAS